MSFKTLETKFLICCILTSPSILENKLFFQKKFKYMVLLKNIFVHKACPPILDCFLGRNKFSEVSLLVKKKKKFMIVFKALPCPS